jgi:NTP pyrophosphatase (non-canonical NTP hydrolase)
MTLNEYQQMAINTAIYDDKYKVNYPILGLVGEAGELANKYKKVLRDHGGIMPEDKLKELRSELGDCAWYLATIARDLDITLEEVCAENLVKLESRMERNVIAGSGDNR